MNKWFLEYIWSNNKVWWIVAPYDSLELALGALKTLQKTTITGILACGALSIFFCRVLIMLWRSGMIL